MNRTCSLCKQQGHKRNNIKFHPVAVAVATAIPVIPAAAAVQVPITDEIRSTLKSNFIKCVKGYHLINNDPIKEAPWEDINSIILNASGCTVHSQSNGSHKSGEDLSCSLGKLSNKSTKYEAGNKSFNISSYRLTKVSSGGIEDIISEINKRKNFDFYSIIVRNDELYDWYLIPSDYPVFNPASYKWELKLGKNNKSVGWKTDTLDGSSMSITFSMSSQLWMNIHVTEEMQKFIVGSCNIHKGRELNYIELFEKSCTI